jgi:nucleotide-binding universal stress UspA family protein
MAKAFDSGVVLLNVWEGGEEALVHRGVPIDGGEDLFERGKRHYEEYLAGVAKRVEGEGIQVETHLGIGGAVEVIQREIGQRDPRMLVLATHGRSGLGRWWYGSVASRLVREAPVPTLVVGPTALEAKTGGAVQRILVPLDGSELGERALPMAIEMAKALGASVLLAEVMRWAAQTYALGGAEVNVAMIDEELKKAAESYLDGVAKRLDPQLKVTTEVLRGAPADCLIDLVAREHVDLIVMSSHTRGGVARAVLGSVADRMTRSNAPVLLVRPEGVSAQAVPRKGYYCHNCGRASPYSVVTPDDWCLRCGQHLRACGNCVYYTGLACQLQRPEEHDTYPGRLCPYFQFRETESAGPPPAAS